MVANEASPTTFLVSKNFLDTCPDGTDPADVKVFIDSVQNMQTLEMGRSEIKVDPSQSNQITIEPIATEGSFKVTFAEGIAGETDAEIASRKFQGTPWPL